MNKKGFTLIELLVSITLIATISYFLFQIIFIVRDIYIEKTVKSELYIETANASNLINKDIISKMNNGINVYGANKISNDAVDLVFTNADVMQISIDRTNNKIKYGTYSVDISKDAKIGNINLYYNFDENDLEKNGVFFIKIPVSLEKYNTDFSIYIYSRYDSSYAIMGGEILAISERCEYANGYTWSFDYTGGIQEFEVPCNGTYKLEVWGAGGASGGEGNASKGGYSSGDIVLSHNQKVYICVGSSAGYNGGGAAYGYGSGTGGGATHIALNNDRGILQYYDLYREDIAIVAGGGGGGAGVSSNSCCSDQKKAGGAGGGENGVSANGSGGTQTTGYAFGIGGKGGGFRAGGGGGGWYGGKSCTSASNGVCTGGGGSGYIGGVTDGSTIAGNAAMPKHDGTEGTMTGNAGNGYARITLISY